MAIITLEVARDVRSVATLLARCREKDRHTKGNLGESVPGAVQRRES